MSKKENLPMTSSNEHLAIYRDLVETSQDLIWQCDSEGRYIYLNPAWESTFGYTIEEMLGKKFSDFQTLEMAKRDTEEFNRLMHGNMVNGYETVHIGKVGNKIHLVFNAKFVRNGSGKVIGTRGTAHDITERKKAEEELKLSEQRYRFSLEVTGQIGWSCFPDGSVEDAPMWRQYTGQTKEEAAGWHWLDPIHPEDREAAAKAANSAVARKNGYETEYRLRRADGVYRNFMVRGKLLYNSDGTPREWVGTCIDITDRKRIVDAIQSAQRLESLGVLAGGIAHDFNNLMGGIFGYMDMALEKTKEAKVTSYLSKAMNTIERARALTGQLLTFAKGGAPIQKIDHLFPFVEETARFALSGANVSCHFDVQQDLWACNFDKNQIGQVIDNLIINAQQAMPVGGTIELTARNITLSEKEHPLLKNENYVKISIKDTGIGIAKELITKIFDPFFTTKAMGHGLGLATCYSIINRHGGCIDVESEPGKGSTFKVYLPASTEAASFVSKNTAKRHKGSGAFLVMDDEEVMRDTVRGLLEILGYTVIGKENGKDAIDFFASETKSNRTIAGMIFDLTVPGGMGGKEAIEEIRKTNSDIPAFVASGYADDPVMKNPTEYGFSASICKPFRIAELSEMLNKYMKPEK